MFGTQYKDHVGVLLREFGGMSKIYNKKVINRKSAILQKLQKLYIGFFGIPEIGLQVRSLYFKEMLANIQKSKIQSILDAGCGIGAYTFYLSNYFPDANVIGCDIDKKKLRFCQKVKKSFQKKNNIQFVYGNLEKQRLQAKKFDLIVNIDVLEHVKNYRAIVKNFYRALSSEGFLYIHTPQRNQKRFFKRFKQWHHEDHAREGFLPLKLKKDLKVLGFSIIYQRNTHGFFGSLAWEINHLLLEKSFILAGIAFPFLYMIARCDLFINNNYGLGIAILARKDTV